MADRLGSSENWPQHLPMQMFNNLRLDVPVPLSPDPFSPFALPSETQNAPSFSSLSAHSLPFEPSGSTTSLIKGPGTTTHNSSKLLRKAALPLEAHQEAHSSDSKSTLSGSRWYRSSQKEERFLYPLATSSSPLPHNPSDFTPLGPTAPLLGLSAWSPLRAGNTVPTKFSSWELNQRDSPFSSPASFRPGGSTLTTSLTRIESTDSRSAAPTGSAYPPVQSGQDWFDVERAWSARPNAVLSSPSRPTTRGSSSSGSTQRSTHQLQNSGGRLRNSQSSSNRSIVPDVTSRARSRGRVERDTSPERKQYHPKAPSGGSDWVMWVGNVPHDASHEEATTFFNSTSSSPARVSSAGFERRSPAEPEDTGIQSIFLILQSHCAFVNYSSDAHLQRALHHFNGRPFRYGGIKLVCRVRRKAEEMKSGVGGQRGLGLHRKWIEQHGADTKPISSINSRSANLQGVLERYSVSLSKPPRKRSGSVNSATSTSTTSTLLEAYFPVRYFVIKAMTKGDLELSIYLGLWATQSHNELVLDQAFRTSRDVYLVFGANKAGEFHGFARMESLIPQGTSPKYTIPPLDLSRGGTNMMSPFERHLRQWEASTTPEEAGNIHDPDSSSFSVTSPSPAQQTTAESDTRGWGTPFRVHWLSTRGLPFHSTRMLRNPWNKDREVKVSRDGTELEPAVGSALLDLWDYRTQP